MRATATAVALAATLWGLTGCVTVHGETALVPATTPQEAERVLQEYAEVTNEAQAAYDPDRVGQVSRAALGEIQRSSLTAHQALAPDGDQNHTPFEFTDPAFHIPRQAAWPKFFVADTGVRVGDAETHWLLVFSRDAIDEEWKAAYRATVTPADIPEFTTDADGYVEALRGGEGEELLLDPGELGKAYTAYLQDGEGAGEVFADGAATTGRRETRADSASTATARHQWSDSPADPERFPALGLAVEDGSAWVFFTVHQHTRKTMAEGITPEVPELMRPLLEGEPKQSLTTSYLYTQLVDVPPAEAAEGEDERVSFLYQDSGLISAKGE
ncbi:hypothetical protein JJV70_20890 [Streptomyces sp. JJ66]|uniref:hypothetical protein n=1 Tax=Streptomyces sp. JJ66 TaxID=2803843 RepID=UPI001C570A63|nr:hypothetical protein [Streptomyces sp. JJ66]MBW1604515.1 hypothetical protein [Streptomyces sp. JJ66]